jgi:serine/threonine protein kinase
VIKLWLVLTSLAANILISTNGTVKLADFGVATKLDAVGADTDPAGSPYWSTYTLIHHTYALCNAVWHIL